MKRNQVDRYPGVVQSVPAVRRVPEVENCVFQALKSTQMSISQVVREG
jgi:hypothetical protein